MMVFKNIEERRYDNQTQGRHLQVILISLMAPSISYVIIEIKFLNTKKEEDIEYFESVLRRNIHHKLIR